MIRSINKGSKKKASQKVVTILHDNLLLGEVGLHPVENDVHDGVAVVLALSTASNKATSIITTTKGVRHKGVHAPAAGANVRQGDGQQ